MNAPLLSRLFLCSAVTLALSACGGSDNDDAPMKPDMPAMPAMEAGDVFALTASNKLVSFNRDAPGTVRTSVAISGLQSGENLRGIDFRPADGMLYGVGSSGRRYTIDTGSGMATVKSTLAADAADTSAPYTALAGADFGVDFNPVADRMRVVSASGQSLRINVDSGATTTDGAINGVAGAAVTGSAYTNSFAGTATTMLFAIDAGSDMLYLQNPPNNGTLATPVALGVDAGSVSGFDIDARTNMGYGVFTVGGARNLYTINLAATGGAATLVGALGVTEDVRGIAVRGPGAPAVYALADDGKLLRFKSATPNTIDASVGITGLNAGETLVGIDFRPKDGMLYGLSSAGRVLTIDTATGAATLKATLAADTPDTTLPYTGVAGTAFAVDFNPVADRLRVISNTGLNLRINVDTGATTTDGAINFGAAGALASAAAYTNSYAGATTTQLFDIATVSDSLVLQSPPNDGVLSSIGALGVAVEGDIGMDIAGGANGLALAALRGAAGGASALYRIDLATGAATLVNGAATPATSSIGAGVGVRDIAIALK
jgi:hypothetical protein